MFESEELKKHLQTVSTIETESVVFVEWNLNDADNVEKLGNYRYRPGTTDGQFSSLITTYDPLDVGGYYTGATDARVGFDTNVDDQDIPVLFTTKNEKMSLLYSLEDCINPHRPRSGINKLLYLGDTANQYLDIGDKNVDEQEVLNIARRPRYYMSSRKDPFKYWTSYRTDIIDGEQEEFGVSRNPENGISYIYDAAPFVVYKEEMPVNRIVVKMQTNVGDINLGPFRSGNQDFPDPLFGFENQTTPQRWSIQVLKDNNWVSVIDFDENSVDENNEPVIKNDGYVEIAYGLDVPEFYKRFMTFVGEISDESLLPEQAPFGYTYLLKQSDTDRGILKFYDGGFWINIVPEYRWFLGKQNPGINFPVVTKISDPDNFINDAGQVEYREIDIIRGIRIVAKTMNVPQCTFDLIEMSPRIVVDFTEKTTNFEITKTMADLGNSSIPVGNVLAAVGTIEILDDDSSFNLNNIFNSQTKKGSVIAKYLDHRAKFLFYQVVKNVDEFDYFIPIKTMYSDEIPVVSNSTGIISFNLRDLFFLFESEAAPEILITDASISYAVTLLLDYIGFSNYVFKRIEDLPEIVIPFFFVQPDMNVAEILRQLAVASQTAMFFDEFNNFVVMSKEYLLPEENQREIDLSIYGQEIVVNNLGEEFAFLGNVSALSETPNEKQNGAYVNTQNNLMYVWSDNVGFWQPRGTFAEKRQPNIINLASEEKRIYNQGNISYTTRYLQRSISRYAQAPYIEKFKTYGYKPALLWEVSGREQIRSQNETPQQSQGYTLSAAPLNTDLSDEVPTVVGGQIINNVIDVGDAAENVAAYSGYFYANGEVIQYDAMQYAVSGSFGASNGTLVWITSPQEYQKYFSRLPFNGKMYPTGLLRVFVEPEFETDENGTRFKDGPVKRHGRGQFGTPVVAHSAGLNDYWSDNENVKGCLQQAKEFLFDTSQIINYPSVSQGVAGKIDTSIPGIPSFNADVRAQDSSRVGVIKNFRTNKYYSELEDDYFSTNRAGTLQASALVFSGPELPEQVDPANFVSYVYKDLPGPYKHFGTRMRIIGKIESVSEKNKVAAGAFTFYNTQDINLDNPEKDLQILGGSGGLAINLNKETNNGYYFEIASLTQDNLTSYEGIDKKQTTRETVLSQPQPSISNNVVVLNMQNPTEFQVGQRVVISGLVDSNATQNAATPLNGEYAIEAITDNKKKIRYTIPSPSVPTLSITDVEVKDRIFKYNIPIGDTRQTFIKPGDKITIANTNNSIFNLSNVYVKDFQKLNTGWYFSITNPYATTSATSNTIASSGTKTFNVGINLPYAAGQTVSMVVNSFTSMTGSVSSYNATSGELVVNISSSTGSGTYSIWTINIVATATGGTVSYVPLTTTVGGSGAVSFTQNGRNIVSNVFFYKIMQGPNNKAIPIKIWSGTADIIPDDGKFTGQYRMVSEENPTVYDLAVEHVQVGSARRFYLFINGRQVATVDDLEPLPEYSNCALFVRGTSQCMFENVYAIGANIAQNSTVSVAQPISKFNSFWGDNEIDANKALRKYALSGVIQKTYLSGIGTEEPPSHSLYFEEFGTILREVAYLNIKYDRAYPALFARIMNTFNRLKGYAVSGFYAGSYGADFLIFNCLDTNINLDDTTGNFLRIQGVTFTQNTTKELTVDEYYKKLANFSNPVNNLDGTVIDPFIKREEFDSILNSRSRFGSNEFSIETNYIQTDEAAEDVFGWVLKNVIKPKILVGINTFGTFNLQLGDIVKVNYINNQGIDVISSPDKRFVVYSIQYTKSSGEENFTTYLAEV